ncbi:MAG: hemerythrin domain-containing protein [Rhodospirillaceae bacterium]|nr:hemerythrin domain-containing protein [Rhodospirillaceae bacterium]MBL6930637.1 hemerythrin domain-containing protein [Rhodospirillales bacterium]
MVKIEWLESFAIGIKAIDDDHKKILQTMQDIQVAVEKPDYDLCASLLDELVILGAAHFANEEEYLAEVSYPYIEEHILYHQELLLKIKAVKATCMDTDSQDGLEECFNSMAEFLIDDIIAGDLQFKSYLQARGLVK